MLSLIMYISINSCIFVVNDNTKLNVISFYIINFQGHVHGGRCEVLSGRTSASSRSSTQSGHRVSRSET